MAIVDRRGVTVSATDPAEGADPNPGLGVKTGCAAATAANLTLSGLQTVGGVALAEGDRVLVKSQTAQADNGIYVASSGTWKRAGDADASSKLAPGLLVPVARGDFAGKVFMLTALPPVVLGTSNLVFVATAGSGDLLAANNLSDLADAATAFSAIKQVATNAATGVVKVSTAVTALAGSATDEALRVADAADVYAPIASPTFTGTVIAPTPALLTDDSTKVATTAWVQDVVDENIAAIDLPQAGAWVGHIEVFRAGSVSCAVAGSTTQYVYSPSSAPSGSNRLRSCDTLAYTALASGSRLRIRFACDFTADNHTVSGAVGTGMCALLFEESTVVDWCRLPITKVLNSTDGNVVDDGHFELEFRIASPDTGSHTYQVMFSESVLFSANDWWFIDTVSRRYMSIEEASA